MKQQHTNDNPIDSLVFVCRSCICVTFFTPPTCIMHIDQMQMQIVAVRKMAWIYILNSPYPCMYVAGIFEFVTRLLVF